MYEHYRQLHVGPQALLASIREKYWPMNGWNIARTVVNKCIICFKTKPYTFQPIMGDLPKSRVQPGRAFAGPIKTKARYYKTLWSDNGKNFSQSEIKGTTRFVPVQGTPSKGHPMYIRSGSKLEVYSDL
jgi:hypothetical protein